MKIQSKFTEYLLAPSNAVPAGDGAYETLDGFKCLIEYQATWNNEDGRFDDELENTCRKLYNCSFNAIKSIWVGRIGKIEKFWHLIKLEKI